MFRSLMIVMGLLAGFQPTLAAPWELPMGVKTLTVNNYPMAYRESGSGETVVLVHGAANDYRYWDALMKSAPAGFRLIALSLRHHYPERWDGKGGRYSVKQHAEDLAAFIEALGVGPVHLVARSLGGTFAVRMTRDRPELVKKLVLIEGAFLQLLPPEQRLMQGASLPAIRKEVQARFEQGDIDGGLKVWTDRDAPGLGELGGEERRQLRRDNAWTLIIMLEPGGPVTCTDLAGLAMPVLLMQGEKTAPRFARIVETTRKCLPSPEFVKIPEAGHDIVKNTTATQAALFTFLKK